VCLTDDGLGIDGGIWGVLIGLAALAGFIALLVVTLRFLARSWRDS
jgi:hypothetical protein